MAHAGHIVENPVTGERCRWHLTSADTDGALVRAEFWVRPLGGVSLEHVHERSEERFEVLAGRLILSLAGERRVLLTGERARVPAGTPHAWHSGGEDELHVLVELDQPGDFEGLLEALFAAARAGRTDDRGNPGLIDGAVMLREHPAHTYTTVPPRWLQRLVVPPLALLGRALRRGAHVADTTVA
jgi:mannose-6-phosphate isomerase-like protein (cupin superfamily)